MEFTFFSEGTFVKGSSVKTSEGAEEFFITVNSSEEPSFAEELEKLYDSYLMVMDKCGLSDDTMVFGRFFLSDIVNQKDALVQSKIYDVARKGAVSVIQQCPVDGGSVCLFVYHIKSKNDSFNKEVINFDNEYWCNGVLIHGNYYDLLWTTNFSVIGPLDSYKQTSEIFQSFKNIINESGMNLLDNVVRTWFYVRDIDNHYTGMVESRKAFFEEHGLTPETHYIASTGIGGISKEVNSLVSFDALSINKLKREQIVRMAAPENLSPTITYGGTFERGTRIRFGDRSHLYISGTASIDKNGNVIYFSDIKKQTQRTLDNIKALLDPHGAGLQDMAYLIVYLRSFKYKKKVMEVLEREIHADIPFILVESAVCRPAWLVEIEGIGIIPDSNDFPAFF